MANDYQLKTIVLGLENWAMDCVTLAKFLNLRSQLKGHPLFTESLYVPPPLPTPANPYPSEAASLKRAADKLDHVVDRNDDTVTDRRAIPTTTVQPVPPVVKVAPNKEETIRLIVHWLATISGSFKTVLRLYGEKPQPIPEAPHPGPKPELLVFAEIAAWIEKIGKDADSFAAAQNIPTGPPVLGRKPYDTSGLGVTIDASLARLELGLHKLAQDIHAIASILPYHILRAVQ